MKYKVEMSLDRVQVYFLKQRYGTRKSIPALIKCAALESISCEANKATREIESELQQELYSDAEQPATPSGKGTSE